MAPPPPLSSTPDHSLAKSAAEGNQQAFAELDRRYRASVRQSIEHLVDDPDLAEDLTQDTFIKALEKLDTFRPESRFAPWILKIANNVALDYLKKEKRLERKGLGTVPLEPTPDISRPQRKPAALHRALDSDSTPTRPHTGEARRIVQDGIQQLRGQQRHCMQLREIDGLSYENIAQMLGLPVGTVSSYVTRGRKKLKRILGPNRDLLRPE